MSTVSTAAEALDAIRVGSDRMLMSAYQRLIECKKAMEVGDFTRAAECGAQVMDRLQVLSMASERLGALSDGYIVKIADLETGMETESGVIVEILNCDCDEPECQKRRVRFDNGTEVDVQANWEIRVVGRPHA